MVVVVEEEEQDQGLGFRFEDIEAGGVSGGMPAGDLTREVRPRARFRFVRALGSARRTGGNVELAQLALAPASNARCFRGNEPRAKSGACGLPE